MINEKRCQKCKAVKPVSEFYKAARESCGLQGQCKSCQTAYGRNWVEKNRERQKERTRRWRLAHPERWNSYSAKHRKEHPAWYASKVTKERAAKLHATPMWANQFFIEEIYDIASHRSLLKSGGVDSWHVDHIVPLQSPIVCGLHVHNNLRVIPSKENMMKGNRHWPDMP